MKQLFLPLLVIALLTASFNKYSKKSFLPPGTVQINDTLFADETEISNFSWLEYTWNIATIYGKDSKEYKSCLPDTLVWREKSSYNEPYVTYYFRHVAYRNFPVVGISYEQALNFCKWRTERVNAFLTLGRKFKYPDFEYRLPTKTEWEKLAEFSTHVLYNNGKNDKGKYQINCAHPDTIGTPYPDVTAPVRSYSKSLYGLYNMLGNVTEMVHEKGISKGGGWRNNLEDCRVGKQQEYSKPTAWMGFRCVCVIKKKTDC